MKHLLIIYRLTDSAEHKKHPCPSQIMGGGQMGWSLHALEALWPGKGVAGGPRKVDQKQKVTEPDSKVEAGTGLLEQ